MASDARISEGTAVWAKWRGFWWAAIVARENDANEACRRAKPRKNVVLVFYVETAAFAWSKINNVLPITEEPYPIHEGSLEAGRELVSDTSLPRIEMIHRLGKCMLDITDGLHVKCIVKQMQTLEAWQDFATQIWEVKSYLELGRHLLDLTKLILPKYFTRKWTTNYRQWKGECERADNVIALEKLIKRLRNGVDTALVQDVWDKSENQTAEWDMWRGDKWEAWDEREELKETSKRDEKGKKIAAKKKVQQDQVSSIPENKVPKDDVKNEVPEEDVERVCTFADKQHSQKTKTFLKRRRKRKGVALSNSLEMDGDEKVEDETSVPSVDSHKGKREENDVKRQKLVKNEDDTELVGTEMETEDCFVKKRNYGKEVTSEVENNSSNDGETEIMNEVENNSWNIGKTEVINEAENNTLSIGNEMEVDSSVKKSNDGKKVNNEMVENNTLSSSELNNRFNGVSEQVEVLGEEASLLSLPNNFISNYQEKTDNLFPESSNSETVSYAFSVQDSGDEITSTPYISVNPSMAHLVIFGPLARLKCG